MAEKIVEYLSRTIQNEYALIALLAMIPVTEIKGAVLYAAVTKANLLFSFLCAFAASSAMSFLVVPFSKAIINKAERSRRVRRLLSFLTGRLESKADKIMETAGAKECTRYQSRLMLGLFAFVAVPLPFTGIWAGAMLAAIMHLNIGKSLFALIAGNFTAGGVVLTISVLAGENASLVLNVFLYVAIALFCILMMKAMGKRLSANRKSA